MTEKTSACLSRLEDYTWIVFTSSNGVLEFFRQLRQLELDHRKLGQVKFAVIGKGTEKTLRDFGFIADFVPSVYSSQALAKEWVPTLTVRDRVLFVRAKESSRDLPRALNQAGIAWDGAAVYQTVTDQRREDELRRLGKDMDYIVLSSGSGARAFASMWKPEGFHGKIVSIGPVTTKEAEKAGIRVDITAAVFTAEGIAEAVLADVRKEKEG